MSKRKIQCNIDTIYTHMKITSSLYYLKSALRTCTIQAEMLTDHMSVLSAAHSIDNMNENDC